MPEKKEACRHWKGKLLKLSPSEKSWNDCHDQFTALIARDYTLNSKLPTVDRLTELAREWMNSGSVRLRDIAKAIHEEIMKL